MEGPQTVQSDNRWVFESNDPLEACTHRNAFVAYLRHVATPDSDFEAAELVYGELIGNVVRHAYGHIKVVVEWRDNLATLCVADEGNGFYRNFALPESAVEFNRGMLENGRGLAIVRQLSNGVRVNCDTEGCEVQAVLPVRRAA
jgi:anti-sigma regulatory factor (Ser/Thr protein kinase)